MIVTLSGIVTLLKLVLFENAKSPILITLSVIVIFDKFVHSENAELPILVTLFGIEYTLSVLPAG